MNQFLRYTFFTILIFTSTHSFAQNKTAQDSVVELYGVVMTADSLQAIPAASVIVENKLRGTFTNDHGVFSIVVLKGDHIRFSCIGFKDKEITIPANLQGDQYSVIQLMVSDTAYLPATILRPRPTRAQFERDFVNTDVPADQIEIARENTEESKRRALIAALPADGQEAVAAQMRQQATKYSYMGQVPPQNIFNPVAWAEFIQAWKRGDFKRKDQSGQ
jgi:hypothetical protein